MKTKEQKSSIVPKSSAARAVILLQAAVILLELVDAMDKTEGTSIFSTFKVRAAAETAERLGNDYAELANRLHQVTQ